ncbi:hypothetical protein FRB96_002233 [Tulasnella sp. 330]|nr:hypothetical protein FRB96_002233 [Tulasnella sp. 330]
MAFNSTTLPAPVHRTTTSTFDGEKPILVPTLTLADLGFEGRDVQEMLRAAEEADCADHALTIKEAIKKYKVAVFWAMFLSTSLIMEGYDVVMIGSFYGQSQFIAKFGKIGSDGVKAISGTAWGTFQTLSTAYACEVVPTCLRPFVTGYVCICWGAGIVLSSGVVRAVINIQGDLGWKLPFMIQWIWPIPLFIGAYFAPESPWNAVRRNNFVQAKKSLARLRNVDGTTERDLDNALAYMVHTTRLEEAETAGAGYMECFKGTNLRRTEINCVVWAAQILCGNAILGYAVVFLEKAGFGEKAAFNLNLITNCQYIVGGILCWFLMTRLGRATLYMGGMALMNVCLIATGILGFFNSNKASVAIGVLLIVQTLINMTTIGPVCYPIVAETPSGRLRAKTIVIGRIVYNITGIFSNSVTPRMISTTGGLPETKDRTFGEIDLLFENRVPARKFKYTAVDRRGSHALDEKKDSVEYTEHA